jgi:hypothetical protein
VRNFKCMRKTNTIPFGHVIQCHTMRNTSQLYLKHLSCYVISIRFLSSFLKRFQSKALRMVVDAPWYVPNTVIRRDLRLPTVKEEIRRYSSQYSDRLSTHTNNLIQLPDNRRLRRHLPNDLPTRFLV